MTTFGDLLLKRLGDEHAAIRFEGRSHSWDHVVHACADRAATLRPGMHIGVLLENMPDYLYWIGAAALAGSTVVGINTTRCGQNLADDIRHTDVDLLVTDEAGLASVAGLDLPLGPDDIHLIEREEFAAQPVPGEAPPDHTLLLLFTSGSTGAPKAVICSSGRLGRLAESQARKYQVRRGDVLYQCMPMFHGNALMSNIAPAVAVGATVALRRRFSASNFLPDVREHGATYFNYVGRALAYVLATAQGPEDHDNALRLAVGTEASARDIDTFAARFGCEIIENYGSSEGVVSITRRAGTPRGALGLPAAGTDVVVVDGEGRECPAARFDGKGGLLNGDAAIGEIVRRQGDDVFEGYYRNPAAEAERVRAGCFHTGDLAYRDADGWFWFAGRTSDWLRVDSENFAAGPVEKIISRYPGTELAAVYAVPDAQTGDQVMATLEAPSFDAEAFAEFLGSQRDLGSKWAPRYVRLVERMPVTGTNKIDKARLRREGWWDAAEIWFLPVRGDSYRRLTAADQADLIASFAEHGRAMLLPMSPSARAEPASPRTSARPSRGPSSQDSFHKLRTDVWAL